MPCNVYNDPKPHIAKQIDYVALINETGTAKFSLRVLISFQERSLRVSTPLENNIDSHPLSGQSILSQIRAAQISAGISSSQPERIPKHKLQDEVVDCALAEAKKLKQGKVEI
ncbi:hypothetical protein AA313_de0204457 [Arthrobotrys entomopaga]|nr:hypothetical protein AA313_de0204457 [Arthrobotrys entomopaga]